MSFDLSNIDWGGLLNSGLNAYAAHQNAGSNQQAANTYAQQTKFNPYNVIAGNSGVLFNGNSALASLSQPYQNIQGQLTSGAGGLLGGIGQQYQNGGINPQLQGSFDQYNQSAPQNSQDLSGQFNASSQGFLGGLGSFDPNQAAQSYTNNLRSQAQPQNQRSAESLAQGLFNTGRLGSTGGANLYGDLVQQQNQQDLGFQIAGQQYGGQEQSRIAGLAGQQAQLGAQFGQQQYDQTNARAQSRFQNAMSLFGAGQQNIQGQLQGGLGLLQGSQGLDQDLLKAIQTGGYLGGASSSANSQAYNPSMQANVAGNNASSAGWLGIAQALGLPGQLGGALGSLLGGGGGAQGGISSGLQGGTPGMPDTNGMNSADLNKWLGIPENNYTNTSGNAFSGAGGQAATPQGGGSLQNPAGFLGGLANIPNGLQNLGDLGSKYGAMDDAALYKELGVNPNMLGSAGGANLGKAVGAAGNALGIYSGIQKGGAAGYAQAGNSAAGLLGKDIPALGYADAVSKLAKGDVGGAGISAFATASPIAAAMFAATDALNAGGDKRTATNESFIRQLLGKGPTDNWNVGGRSPMFKLPTGEMIRPGKSLEVAAKAFYSGDKAAYDKAYADMIKNKGQ